jgi:hypothetical protein
MGRACLFVGLVSALVVGLTAGPGASARASLVPEAALGPWSVQETDLGPSGDGPIVSLDRRHVARAVKKAGRRVVMVDQAETAVDGGMEFAAFDPESRRFAFQTKRDGQSRLVVDGVEQWSWKGPGLFGLVKWGFWFSPRGGHWFLMTGRKGFAVSTLQNPGQYALVVDGKLVAEGIEVGVTVSDDGRSFGYIVRIADPSGQQTPTLVVHGPEGERSRLPGVSDDCHCQFSPDDTRLTHSIRRNDSWVLVVDGVEGREYEELRWPEFSPDGKRLAYAARRSGKWLAVVDAREEGPWDEIKDGRLWFSADGKRLAYRAKREGKWVAVVNGSAGDPYDEVGRPVFSPDGSRLAYRAKTQGKWSVVLDGHPGPAYDDIAEDAVSETGMRRDDVAFSPDGARIVYRARKDKGWLVEGGGSQAAPYDDVAQPAISPDGKHVAYAARRAKAWVLVVDGVEGGEYDFLTDRRVVFDDPRRLHTVIRRGDEYRLLGVEIPEP